MLIHNVLLKKKVVSFYALEFTSNNHWLPERNSYNSVVFHQTGKLAGKNVLILYYK